MDCEELHDSQKCPACGSETFAYISRWIPAPERRQQNRPKETVETHPVRLSTPVPPSGRARWLRRGAVGMATVAAFGWAWQRSRDAASRKDDAAKETEPPSLLEE